MKKIYIFALLLLGSAGVALSQSQRLVLVEHFTQASCGPCAQYNPAMETLLEQNEGQVVAVKYQTSWPGFDPMYLHNTAESNGRVTYYNVQGVPNSVVDGNAFNGHPADWGQALINSEYAIPASFDIDLDYTITPESIEVTATATATEDVDATNLKMRIVVVEKHISFPSPPGNNGETDFYSVMKKMLPNQGGTTLSNSWTAGDSETVTESWNFSNVYDVEQIAVVAFIQSDADKAVYQAAIAQDVPVVPAYSVDASALNFSNLPEGTCEGVINPTVSFSNYGSETLTSLDINYEISGATGTINWTGSLDFFETEEISLGEIVFEPQDENILEVTFSNPNGVTDENSSNNEISELVAIAAYSSHDIVVRVTTDLYAIETSWEIRNSSNEIVASHQYVGGNDDIFGGGGPDANTTHEHEVTLDPSDCYEFRIFDAYEDGMMYGTNGPWGYEIINAMGNVIVEELHSPFTFVEHFSGLRTDESSSVEESNFAGGIQLFPNPTNGIFNLDFELVNSEKISVEIFNTLGQRINSLDLGTMPSGYSRETIDLTNYTPGMYYVSITSGGEKAVKKITLTK